jgi:heme/copper-type cytochrome/quinol oxidase subunit 2
MSAVCLLAAATANESSGGFVLVLLLAGLALHALPVAVAVVREHHQRAAIIALTVVAGWTLVGWIVAFVWSCTAVKKPGRRRSE